MKYLWFLAAMIFASSPAQAVPYECLRALGAVEGSVDRTPFLDRLFVEEEASLSPGSAASFDTYLRDNLPRISEATVSGLGEELEALMLCEAWAEAKPIDQRADLAYARAAMAIAALRTARAEGNEPEVRRLADIAREAIARSRDMPGASQTLAQRLNFQSFEDFIARAVEDPALASDADVLVYVRDALNEIVRPGASWGGEFSNYIEAIGAPVREALDHLANAAIQRERAVTVMLRVIDHPKVNPPGPALLKDRETNMRGEALETYREVTGRLDLPRQNEGSVLKMTRLRDEVRSILATRGDETSGVICFLKTGDGSKIACEDATSDMSEAIGTTPGINPFEFAYPGARLERLVPLQGMDNEIRIIAGILADSGFPALDEDRARRMQAVFKGLAKSPATPPLAILTADSQTFGISTPDTTIDLSLGDEERTNRALHRPCRGDQRDGRPSKVDTAQAQFDAVAGSAKIADGTTPGYQALCEDARAFFGGSQ